MIKRAPDCCSPALNPPGLPTADDATRADLAVRRDTVTPFWWGLKTLFKVRGGGAAGRGGGGGEASLRLPEAPPSWRGPE